MCVCFLIIIDKYPYRPSPKKIKVLDVLLIDTFISYDKPPSVIAAI